MKIVTCVKQVPASTNVDVDKETGVLIRDGIDVKMNPYDMYALEIACQIKQKQGGELHAVTMGPPSAKSVLKEALYMGADYATLISDRRFAGADVLATAYTISQAIDAIDEVDLIICGKQTTDGDTAQVGPEIAELLNIPHVPYVTDVIDLTEKTITVEATFENYVEIIKINLPCLITVDKGHLVPRLPSFKRKRIKQKEQINVLTLDDFKDQNQNNYGLNGSPTQVVEIFPPSHVKETIYIDDHQVDAAQKLIEILTKYRFLG